MDFKAVYLCASPIQKSDFKNAFDCKLSIANMCCIVVYDCPYGIWAS